jgi:hypothetical protein
MSYFRYRIKSYVDDYMSIPLVRTPLTIWGNELAPNSIRSHECSYSNHEVFHSVNPFEEYEPHGNEDLNDDYWLIYLELTDQLNLAMGQSVDGGVREKLL